MTTDAGADVDKGIAYSLFGGVQTGVTTMEIRTKFPHKPRNRFTI